jgi:hypothetical protein
LIILEINTNIITAMSKEVGRCRLKMVVPHKTLKIVPVKNQKHILKCNRHQILTLLAPVLYKRV